MNVLLKFPGRRNLLWLCLAALWFLLLSTVLAAEGEPVPFDPNNPFASGLDQLWRVLRGDYGLIAQGTGWIGALRVGFKLISSHVQKFFERALARVVETSDEGDDHLAASVLSNPLYRLFAFLVDMGTSLKLPLVLPTNVKGEIASGGQRVTALLLPFALAMTLTGCGTLNPDGVYRGNKILYTADQTIVGAYDTLHEFAIWEYENRAALQPYPAITDAADDARANGERWIDSAIALVDAYAENPSEENRTRLQKALAVLRQALRQATQYMNAPPPSVTARKKIGTNNSTR